MDLRNKFTGVGAPGRPLRKLRNVWRGLAFAVGSDPSVAYKMAASAVLLAASFHFRQWVDFMLIFVVTGLVLTGELFNTAVEALCDFVSPGHDPRIGIVKDVAAAAAGVGIVAWAGVIGYEGVRLVRLLLG
jgi:diacylglycerol kinase (ATP)